jgi:hypothetical protein
MDTREFLRPFFETKASMMRFRKQLLATADEQTKEATRIKATFPLREPFVSDGDFIAHAVRFITGGTAIRRRMKREAA